MILLVGCEVKIIVDAGSVGDSVASGVITKIDSR